MSPGTTVGGWYSEFLTLLLLNPIESKAGPTVRTLAKIVSDRERTAHSLLQAVAYRSDVGIRHVESSYWQVIGHSELAKLCYSDGVVPGEPLEDGTVWHRLGGWIK